MLDFIWLYIIYIYYNVILHAQGLETPFELKSSFVVHFGGALN